MRMVALSSLPSQVFRRSDRAGGLTPQAAQSPAPITPSERNRNLRRPGFLVRGEVGMHADQCASVIGIPLQAPIRLAPRLAYRAGVEHTPRRRPLPRGRTWRWRGGGSDRSSPATLARLGGQSRGEWPEPDPSAGSPASPAGCIGRGGMGRVYRAHDRVLGRDVAVKILDADEVADVDFAEVCAREARAAAVWSISRHRHYSRRGCPRRTTLSGHGTGLRSRSTRSCVTSSRSSESGRDRCPASRRAGICPPKGGAPCGRQAAKHHVCGEVLESRASPSRVAA